MTFKSRNNIYCLKKIFSMQRHLNLNLINADTVDWQRADTLRISVEQEDKWLLADELWSVQLATRILHWWGSKINRKNSVVLNVRKTDFAHMKTWRDILGAFRTFLFNFSVVCDRKDFVDGLTPFYWMKWHRQPAF